MKALLSHLPASVKYDILDFMPPQAAAGNACRDHGDGQAPLKAGISCDPQEASSSTTATAHEGVLAALSHQGYFQSAELLGSAAHSVAEAVQRKYATSPDMFRPAGVGQGPMQRLDHSSRGDSIMWVDCDGSSTRTIPELNPLLQWAEGLAASIGRVHHMEFTRKSVQVAHYAGEGIGYVKHRDAILDTGESLLKEKRRITIVYYVNPGWQDSHGGQLRLYPKSRDPELQDLCLDDAAIVAHKRQRREQDPVTVNPSSDTAIIFLSDMEHEVMPVFHPRMAVTVWLYAIQQPFPFTSAHLCDDDHTPKQAVTAPPLVTPTWHSASRFASSFVDNENIFVSIASYRDIECQKTIHSLFTKANHPERVFIGVVHQVDLPADSECFTLPYARPSQVRELRIPHTMATGPCLARHLAQQLYNGEHYYLQIDAHMRVIQGWDTKLVDWLSHCQAIGHVKPVLTTYPPDYRPPSMMENATPFSASDLPNDVDSLNALPTVMSAKAFIAGTLPVDQPSDDEGGDHLLRLQSKTMLHRPTGPVPSFFCAAGFMFTVASAIWEVPYDPHLEYVFFGEESSMMVRLWTSGYDFFAPPETVIYHLWTRAYRPTFWETVKNDPDGNWKYRQQKAQQRVAAVLGTMPSEVQALGSYGLGTVRTLAQYQQLSGVDFARRTIAPINNTIPPH